MENGTIAQVTARPPVKVRHPLPEDLDARLARLQEQNARMQRELEQTRAQIAAERQARSGSRKDLEQRTMALLVTRRSFTLDELGAELHVPYKTAYRVAWAVAFQDGGRLEYERLEKTMRIRLYHPQEQSRSLVRRSN